MSKESLKSVPVRDRAVQVIGKEAWDQLPRELKKELLWNILCPAGGMREYEYHRERKRSDFFGKK